MTVDAADVLEGFLTLAHHAGVGRRVLRLLRLGILERTEKGGEVAAILLVTQRRRHCRRRAEMSGILEPLVDPPPIDPRTDRAEIRRRPLIERRTVRLVTRDAVELLHQNSPTFDVC